MAYASLVSLGHVLKQILDQDQTSFCPYEISSLHDSVVSLIYFFDDYPQDVNASLEKRIRAAANQAEDIIEYQITSELKSEYAYWGLLSCIRKWILPVLPVHFQFSGRKGLDPHNREKLLNGMKSLEDIMEEVIEIKRIRSSKAKDPIVSNSHASSSLGHPPSDKSTVVGLEQDLMEIKGRLCGEPGDKLRIIPIIGMGGVGKTTLARHVYDDRLSRDHFDVHSWVTISQDYDMEKILLGILHSMNLSTEKWIDKMSEERLLEHLYKSLKGRRYLIVMDDVWDPNAWDVIRRAFPDDSNGSRVIITSRHLDVASYVDPSNIPHRMDLMDTEKSWSLLRRKVFGKGKCPSELEGIGRFIAEKCGGLPLAIVVIAGILSESHRIRETWERVARNVNEAVQTGYGKFTKILYLSYKHLPHQLRPCFLYMGAFPDYEISVSKLVKLWAAEGFLKPHGSKNSEGVARGYLEDLINRSLISVSKKKSNGETKTVKIHSLLRDLCVREAQDKKFLHIINDFSFGFRDNFYDIHDSRRLSVYLFIMGNFPFHHDSPTRTILFSLLTRQFSAWRCLKLLRILDASTQQFTSFPAEIGELFHLRYLAITFAPYIKFTVPRSLSNLQNLQTLIILPHNFKLGLVDGHYMVPLRIWRLPQLRHLILSKFYLPDFGAGTLTVLEDLDTLAYVINFTCSEKVLRMTPNLKKLEIFYLPSDLSKTGWSKYGLNKLVGFHVLEKLNLHVKLPEDTTPFQKFPFPTLQKFDITFPDTLKKLTLSGCGLPWSDMAIIGSLPSLEVLKLKSNACSGDVWETSEGEYCRLKSLLIEKADVQQWETESSHFPCLEQLVLRRCQFLSEIPRCIGDVPTLKLIWLEYCGSLIEESAMSIKEEQHEFGNDDIEVHIVP